MDAIFHNKRQHAIKQLTCGLDTPKSKHSAFMFVKIGYSMMFALSFNIYTNGHGHVCNCKEKKKRKSYFTKRATLQYCYDSDC